MKKRKLKIPFRPIIIILVLALVTYLFFSALSHFLWTSEYFNIKKIISNDKYIDLSYLQGKNIFALNLRKEADRILRLYPNYNQIKLRRELPDCIKAQLQKRQALAYVKLYRYFTVDSDGIFFNLDNNILNQNLPLIIGLESKIFGAKSGTGYAQVKELQAALTLIREASLIRGLKGYQIKRIDTSSLANLTFYILENIEIKIGPNDIDHKLRLLNSVLAQIKGDLNSIRYIDLRFKDPVIKYKYEK